MTNRMNRRKAAIQDLLDMMEKDADNIVEIVARRLNYAVLESIDYMPAGASRLSNKAFDVFRDGVKEALRKLIETEREILSK